MGDISDYIPLWHNRHFGNRELSLTRCVESLGTSQPLIEIRRVGSRWIVYDMKKDKPAVLQHAGVLSMLMNPDTGNYVPPGEDIPPGLYENRVETIPSWRCKTQVSFDTTVDKTFFNLQRTLEAHVCTLSGFNSLGRPRRRWGDGTFSDSFSTDYSIFKTSAPSGTMRRLEYLLHPWVRDALKLPGIIANPERPRMFAFREDELVPVGIGGEEGAEWYPDLRPIDYVRIGHVGTGHPPGFGLDQLEASRLASGKVVPSNSDVDAEDEVLAYVPVRAPEDMSDGTGSASYSESTLPSEIEVFGGGNMERGSLPPWLLSQLDKDFAPSIVPLPVEATAEDSWLLVDPLVPVESAAMGRSLSGDGSDAGPQEHRDMSKRTRNAIKGKAKGI